jgi:imidazoleglycerol-phosphate dehydratase
VEDVAIVLGQAIRQALGDKAASRATATPSSPRRGARAGRGRHQRSPYLVHTGEPAGSSTTSSAATSPGALVRHTFEAIAFNGGLTVHVTVLGGRDPHHIAEAEYKAFARAFRQAKALDPLVEGIPSTKGAL